MGHLQGQSRTGFSVHGVQRHCSLLPWETQSLLMTGFTCTTFLHWLSSSFQIFYFGGWGGKSSFSICMFLFPHTCFFETTRPMFSQCHLSWESCAGDWGGGHWLCPPEGKANLKCVNEASRHSWGVLWRPASLHFQVAAWVWQFGV